MWRGAWHAVQHRKWVFSLICRRVKTTPWKISFYNCFFTELFLTFKSRKKYKILVISVPKLFLPIIRFPWWTEPVQRRLTLRGLPGKPRLPRGRGESYFYDILIILMTMLTIMVLVVRSASQKTAAQEMWLKRLWCDVTDLMIKLKTTIVILSFLLMWWQTKTARRASRWQRLWWLWWSSFIRWERIQWWCWRCIFSRGVNPAVARGVQGEPEQVKGGNPKILSLSKCARTVLHAQVQNKLTYPNMSLKFASSVVVAKLWIGSRISKLGRDEKDLW